MASYNPYNPYAAGLSSMPAPMPNTSGEPRLTFFITRQNGLPVALIPADELPFVLESVPRVLSPAQTYGMHYVGSAGYPTGTFKLQGDANGMHRSTSQPGNETSHYRFHSADNTKHFQAPDALARQAFANSAAANPNTTTSILPKRPLSASQAAVSWRRSDPPLASNTNASEATQNAINAILRSEAGAETAERIGYRPQDHLPAPSGIVPDQDKKVYCTHWILNGWCGFDQQGCRYKHEMPDKAKLTEIGIKHVPNWWKEQNAVFKMGGVGGGRMATVGPVVKPEEWLNARKGSDADSERSSSSEGSEGTTLTSESEKKETPVKKTPIILKRGESEKEKVKKEEQDPPKKSSSSGSLSPIVPPARPTTPADEVETRKMSTSSDLIKFTPLQPLVVKQPEPAKRIITPDAITSKARELSNTNTKPNTTTGGKKDTMKVFVPRGESPDLHIADAKKRERAARVKAGRPSSPKAEETKQAKDTQQKNTKCEGLTASRWANNKAEEPAKRTRSGCRVRRAVSTSPAVKANKATEVAATTEKK